MLLLQLQFPVGTLDYALLGTPHAVDGVTYPNMLVTFLATLRTALLWEDPGLTPAALPFVIGETGYPECSADVISFFPC
jgi:hypothetical protein